MKVHGPNGRFVADHGRRFTRLYEIWRGMKKRCYWLKHAYFKDYGARGIIVCDSWKSSFNSFASWADLAGYCDDLELDRRDNNGNYTPENCQWVTRSVNRRNRRDSHFVTAFGEAKNIRVWPSDPRCRVRYSTLCMRLRNGWDEHDAVAMPTLPKGFKYRRLAV